MDVYFIHRCGIYLVLVLFLVVGGKQYGPHQLVKFRRFEYNLSIVEAQLCRLSPVDVRTVALKPVMGK